MKSETPDQPDRDEGSLAALLAAALDSAAADPVRLDLMTRLFMMTHNTGRDADLARLHREGLPPVFKL